MSRSARLGPVVAIALAVALLVVWQRREPDPAALGGPAGGDAVPAAARNEQVAGDQQRDLASEPDAVRPDDGAVSDPEGRSELGPVLRVRLRGLVAAAPWTEPLRIDLQGRDEGGARWLRHDERVGVAADGTARFTLPAWATTAMRQKGRIEAQDPNYRALFHRIRGPIATRNEFVLDVQAIAVLEGRVVDVRGEPVSAARVTAFALENGRPVEPALGTTSTSMEGHYHAEVAPGVPLQLVATPMQPVQISGMRLTGRHGAIADLGVVRADLLPASRQVRGAIGAATKVADIVLPDAARITGIVRRAGGEPVEKAAVVTRLAEGVEVSVNARLRQNPDGTLAMGARVWTDERGRFELPAAPGQRVELRVTEVPGALVHGAPSLITDPAPARAVIELPAPIRLRPTRAGEAAPHATVELGGIDRRCDAQGLLGLVTTEPTRVRARHGRFRSAWIEVSPAQAGSTVELPLTETLTAVAIEFRGSFPVRNAAFRWRNHDGSSGAELLNRGDDSGPFRLYLPPGRYDLHVGPAPGERNGIYLLPVAREVDVDAADLDLVLPARFGGRLTVHVTDGSGRFVAGTCRIRDGAGAVRAGRFEVRSHDHVTRIAEPGRVLADGPNTFDAILPAGTYELELDLPNHGTERRTFTIREREETEVRVRLP